MSRKEFIEALRSREDWREFESHLKSQDRGYLGSFEKWVRDKDGKKFAIHVNTFSLKALDVRMDYSVEISSQFNGLSDDKQTVDLALHYEGQTPEEVVEFFEEAFEALNCDYYERR